MGIKKTIRKDSPLLFQCFARLSGHGSNALPGHMTTPSDRFWLRVTRTLPKKQIGAEVSLSIMEKAVTRRRIGTNIFVALFGAIGFYSVAQYASKERNDRLTNAPDPYSRK